MIWTFLPFAMYGIVKSREWRISGLIAWVLGVYSIHDMIQIDWILQICSSSATCSINVLGILLSCNGSIQGQKSTWEKMPFKVATFCYSSHHNQCSNGLIYVVVPSSKFFLCEYYSCFVLLHGFFLLLLRYFHLCLIRNILCGREERKMLCIICQKKPMMEEWRVSSFSCLVIQHLTTLPCITMYCQCPKNLWYGSQKGVRF
jgi:hypothetical protein